MNDHLDLWESWYHTHLNFLSEERKKKKKDREKKILNFVLMCYVANSHKCELQSVQWKEAAPHTEGWNHTSREGPNIYKKNPFDSKIKYFTQLIYKH